MTFPREWLRADQRVGREWEIIIPVCRPKGPTMTKYEKWEAATTRPLDILGLLFLIDFVAGRLVPAGPPWWQPSLTIISGLVWVAFVIDYVVRLALTSKRWDFVRSHPLDLVMVLVPMLRVLRAILLLRRSFRNISTERIAGSLLAIVGIIVVAGAMLEYAVEHNAPGATITTVGTAFWWAIVTTTTVGYGDTYPVTQAGRLIASVIMLVGIGLIGTVSATVASWFVKHKPSKDGNGGEPPDVGAAIAALNQQLRELTAQQAELQRSIDRLGLDGRDPRR
ncbi:MAG TPA: ion channel [Nakamurella sp.]